jgi:osmotically-inducible protein OsmY
MDMSAMQSDVFKTCLSGNLVTVTANGGIVTLTGIVTQEGAQDKDPVLEVAAVPGLDS